MDAKQKLLMEADAALTESRRHLMVIELGEPQVRFALNAAMIATGKLNALRLLLAGYEEPKAGG